jgi:hypothetical protein
LVIDHPGFERPSLSPLEKRKVGSDTRGVESEDQGLWLDEANELVAIMTASRKTAELRRQPV